jgi:putative NIF3 family GTP cyclohydrolase 1 type 2
MRSDELVGRLDAYFGTREVRGDEWADLFELVYPDPYWREYAEPGYEGRWNGLLVRGADEVTRAATCVFPSDRVIAAVSPGTFLFSEHPIDYGDEPGFLPLSRESFERLRSSGIGFYNVHAPIDHHPEISPSRMCAAGMGVPVEEEFLPIAEGIQGGAAVIGPSDATLDDLAARLQALLGPEVPVTVVRRRAGTDAAGRVAVVGGGGADRDALEAAIERGCETFVTGGVFTRWAAEFLALAESSGIAVVDGTHYGTEKPPQIAMVDWFRGLGLEAQFIPDGPK